MTLGRPKSLGDMTEKDRHARRIKQSADSKKRRRDLVAKMMVSGSKMCAHPLCITPPNDSGMCDHHSNNDLHRPKEVLCIRCGGISMPGGKLCGYHHEEAEERTADIRRINKNARRAAQRKESACSTCS